MRYNNGMSIDGTLRRRLTVDLLIIAVSIAAAVTFAVSGAAERTLAAAAEGTVLIGGFIAGIGFTSTFTTAPATVVLGELARYNHPLLVAVIGGAGALIGDLIIFRFFRDRIAADFGALIGTSTGRLRTLAASPIIRLTLPLLGALIVASPLPDELGLALLGLARLRTAAFIPLSFLLNTAGILVIGIIARQL
jgi:hypothetical protein